MNKIHRRVNFRNPLWSIAQNRLTINWCPSRKRLPKQKSVLLRYHWKSRISIHRFIKLLTRCTNWTLRNRVLISRFSHCRWIWTNWFSTASNWVKPLTSTSRPAKKRSTTKLNCPATFSSIYKKNTSDWSVCWPKRSKTPRTSPWLSRRGTKTSRLISRCPKSKFTRYAN